jgi:hypothetical protein
MPSPYDRSVTLVEIELERGWIYVKLAEPKPEPDRGDLLLRLTIDHWFSAHPHFVMNKTQAVIEGGIVQGINVW